MAPYETLYGRKCKTLIYWDEVGEWKINSVELVEITFEKIRVIRERLKMAHDCQKSYADVQRKELEFEVDDMVFLKVAPWKGMFRFQKREKLNLRYIGPFRIIERIGLVSYRLELPSELSRIHNVFHVSMLRKYVSDPSYVLETPPIKLNEDLSSKVQPVGIVDQRIKELRNKTSRWSRFYRGVTPLKKQLGKLRHS